MSIPTVEELEGRRASLEQIKAAAYDHAKASAAVKANSKGPNGLLASEQRDHDFHVEQMSKLNKLAEDQAVDPDMRARLGKIWMGQGGAEARRLALGGDDVSREQVALTPDQSIESWERAQGASFDPDVTMAGMLRGLAWGMWDDATHAAIRAQGSATGSEGGFLVPAGLSSMVLDRARNQMRVVQAGAMTVPMPSGEYSIARVASDPSTGWRKESAAITDSSATFEKMTLVARTLSALVKIPLELIEDTRDGGSRSVEPLIRNLLSQAIAQEFDRVALLGDGDNAEPVGLLNTDGVSSTSLSAAPTNWDFVVDRAGDVEDANYTPTGAITSPRVGRQLGKLKATDNQPLRRPERVTYPILETNQVPTNLGSGTDESLMFIGEWAQLLLGVRTRLQLMPLRERFMDTGEIGIVAWFRGDVGVARTSAFSIEDAIQA